MSRSRIHSRSRSLPYGHRWSLDVPYGDVWITVAAEPSSTFDAIVPRLQACPTQGDGDSFRVLVEVERVWACYIHASWIARRWCKLVAVNGATRIVHGCARRFGKPHSPKWTVGPQK